MFEMDEDFNFEFGEDILNASFQPAVKDILLNKNSEELNKRKRKLENTTGIKIQRKFPGPAGLLYNESQCNSISPDSNENLIEIMHSQVGEDLFEEMLARMSADFQNNGQPLSDTFNVGWIRKQAFTNLLISKKAPFLCAVIESIECLNSKNPIVTLTLKDKTGAIQGTIIYELYDKYQMELKVGSGIILKNFGVLTARNGTSPHLTITSNNLIRIYAKTNDHITAIDLLSCPLIDLVNLTEQFSTNQAKAIPQTNQMNNKLTFKATAAKENLDNLVSFFQDDMLDNLDVRANCVRAADSGSKANECTREEKRFLDSMLEGLSSDVFTDDF